MDHNDDRYTVKKVNIPFKEKNKHIVTQAWKQERRLNFPIDVIFNLNYYGHT